MNLISIGCLTKSGFEVSFSGLQAIIKQNKTIILTASRSGETLYRADATLAPPTEVFLAASTTVATLATWHERFAHIDSRAVHRMASIIGINGMIVAPGGQKLHESCHGWLLGKMHKQPFTHRNYTTDYVDQLASFLNIQFEIKTAAPGLFVGLILTRGRLNKPILLSISQFIDKLKVTFNMSTSRAVTMPVLKGTPRLSTSTQASPTTVAAVHHIPYHHLVGSILYAALKIRPDVTLMASQLAQPFHNQTIIHWKAAKRILQYLGSTRYHGLEFGGKGHDNNIVVAYSDADYAGDPDSKRSTTGYILVLNGGRNQLQSAGVLHVNPLSPHLSCNRNILSLVIAQENWCT